MKNSFHITNYILFGLIVIILSFLLQAETKKVWLFQEWLRCQTCEKR